MRKAIRYLQTSVAAKLAALILKVIALEYERICPQLLKRIVIKNSKTLSIRLGLTIQSTTHTKVRNP